MKFSNYFNHTRERKDRSEIKMEWIENVFNFPLREVVQNDGRIRRWGFVEEVGKYLRVVILEDQETVHNAFFDRSYKIEK